MQFITTKQVNS